MWLKFLLLATTICNLHAKIYDGGILRPQSSETRDLRRLDGFWDFAVQKNATRKDKYDEKFINGLKNVENVTFMAVPSSYNDIGTDWDVREHVGLVWYERWFFVPKSWKSKDLITWIRFASVSYAAKVWINGVEVMEHEVGHLPFAAQITDIVKFGEENRITVAVDNALFEDTVPQGTIQNLPTGRKHQTYIFDFFNYAGIDRSVVLFTTPATFIDDISISTSLNETSKKAHLNYDVKIKGSTQVTYEISLLDANKTVVAEAKTQSGVFYISNPKLWWPYLMHPQPGYLYTFQVKILNKDALVDIYRLKVGLRSIRWTDKQLLINEKPVYLTGVGKHEDSDIRGKGLDLPLIARDYNLLKWLGVNAFRTSHYPYAEEIMDLADELGIMVIDECPAVEFDTSYSDNLLKVHKQSLTELIKRDKNRPSVIMWSIANEPKNEVAKAGKYFKAVVDHVKTLDTLRPTTLVTYTTPEKDASINLVDITSYNYYSGWYHDAGQNDVLKDGMLSMAARWHNVTKKPVICMEYGGDTVEGYHSLPDFIFSEEYQVSLMSKNFEAFDQLRKEGYLIGEFIWNFADFKTDQSITRVGGNRKGIFTRSRQPKASAHHLRKRYWMLAKQLNNVSLPNDLHNYLID